MITLHDVPQTQFVDGNFSVFPRLLSYLEGGSSFNALNFSRGEYNEATGMNFTGCSTVVSVYLCPSSGQRQPDGGNDGVDPNDPITRSTAVATASTTTVRPATPTSIPRARPPASAWRPPTGTSRPR